MQLVISVYTKLLPVYIISFSFLFVIVFFVIFPSNESKIPEYIFLRVDPKKKQKETSNVSPSLLLFITQYPAEKKGILEV